MNDLIIKIFVHFYLHFDLMKNKFLFFINKKICYTRYCTIAIDIININTFRIN